MLNINVVIMLSTGVRLVLTLWELAPLTPIVVELFIVLQE